MNNTVNQRLEALREEMRREHLAAFIFPSTDPHQGEYVPDHWKGREFISGFDGSAGTAVVTMTGAALWTDSRYFLAADEQLRGTEYQLMKLKIEGTPTIAEWIGKSISTLDTSALNRGGHRRHGVLGGDGEGTYRRAAERGRLDAAHQPRPAGTHLAQSSASALMNPVEIFPMEYAGESCTSKLQRIRQALRRQHADGMLMASLDDIAWTLNLRGTDVHCTPVFVSYLLITSTDATLFINKEKLTPESEAYLQAEHIGVDDYENV